MGERYWNHGVVIAFNVISGHPTQPTKEEVFNALDEMVAYWQNDPEDLYYNADVFDTMEVGEDGNPVEWMDDDPAVRRRSKL